MQVTLSDQYTTLYEDKDKEKWNYNEEVGIAVEKLRILIDVIKEDIYRDIFKVALAAILLDVSNLYRNGKCLSYKKNWKNRKISELDVFNKFDDKIMEIRADIEKSMRKSVQNNKLLLFNEDCRQGIENRVKDSTIDLVITSPPYLNSRDYTDTYMLELKTLGFTKTKEEIRQLREKHLDHMFK